MKELGMRELLNKGIKQYKNQDIALLFSAGVDSLCVLLSCLDVGIRPHLYTFKLKSYDSDDYFTAIKISKLYDLKLTIIEIDDTNVNKLIDDIKYIIKKFKVKKKTAIQCIYPFIYIINKIEEKTVFTGLSADILHGGTRQMHVIGRKDEKAFNDLRLEWIYSKELASYCYIEQMFTERGIKLIDVYRSNQELIDFFMSKTFKELTSPKEKNIAYESYKKEMDEYKLYRRPSPFQINSKVREWHDTLLNTNENINNNKRVTAIYNRYYKEIWGDE